MSEQRLKTVPNLADLRARRDEILALAAAQAYHARCDAPMKSARDSLLDLLEYIGYLELFAAEGR